MDARKPKMKEGILMSGREYSVLKERMEEDECGWSYIYFVPRLGFRFAAIYIYPLREPYDGSS
jgi:hypothetical protein